MCYNMRHENKKRKTDKLGRKRYSKSERRGRVQKEKIYCICCSDFKGVLVSFAAMETERITIEKTEYEQLQELEKAAAALKSEHSRLKLENIILRDKAEKLTRFLS